MSKLVEVSGKIILHNQAIAKINIIKTSTSLSKEEKSDAIKKVYDDLNDDLSKMNDYLDKVNGGDNEISN